MQNIHCYFQYFVIESSKKVLCMICNENLTVLKEYSVNLHYETEHFQNFSKNRGKLRIEKM